MVRHSRDRCVDSYMSANVSAYMTANTSANMSAYMTANTGANTNAYVAAYPERNEDVGAYTRVADYEDTSVDTVRRRLYCSREEQDETNLPDVEEDSRTMMFLSRTICRQKQL
jgi:hypothetical protein